MGCVAVGVSTRPVHLHALVPLLARLLRRLGRRCPNACSRPAICRLCTASCGRGISTACRGCLLLAARGRCISVGGFSEGLRRLGGKVQTLVHLLRQHPVQLCGLLHARHGMGGAWALMACPVDVGAAAGSRSRAV